MRGSNWRLFKLGPNRACFVPVTEPAPTVEAPKLDIKPKPELITESKPSPQIAESKPTPRPKPKIHISDVPFSSPGAGPGPRTLENSPRLASRREKLETPEQDYGFPSPRLSIPRPSPGLPSPRLCLPSPGGFPSMGLTRKGSFGGLGKSHGSSTGLGLNSNSAGAGTGGGQSTFNTSGNRSPLSGRDGDVLDVGGDGRSGDAGSQRSGGAGDGSGVDGSGQGGSGAAQRRGSGRVTAAGMGVALASRGGEL